MVLVLSIAACKRKEVKTCVEKHSEISIEKIKKQTDKLLKKSSLITDLTEEQKAEIKNILDERVVYYIELGKREDLILARYVKLFQNEKPHIEEVNKIKADFKKYVNDFVDFAFDLSKDISLVLTVDQRNEIFGLLELCK